MNVPINPTIIPIIEIMVNIVCHFTLFLTAISPCGQSESLSYVFRMNLPTNNIITNNIPLKTNKPSISFFNFFLILYGSATSPYHNVKNLRIYFIRNLAFSAEDFFLPIHHIGTSQSASHTIRHIEKDSVLCTLLSNGGNTFRNCYIPQSTFFLVCTLATNVPTLVYLRLYRKFY